MDGPESELSIKVTTGGKLTRYVTLTIDALKSGRRVRLSGLGNAVNKCISVAEIAKAQSALLSIRQTNNLEFHAFDTARAAQQRAAKRDATWRIPEIIIGLEVTL